MDKESNVVPIRPRKAVKGLDGKPIQLSDKAVRAIMDAVKKTDE